MKNPNWRTTSVIKKFNQTIHNKDVIPINLSLSQLLVDVASIEAKLIFFELCDKLMANYLFFEGNFGDILNSMTLVSLKTPHASILSHGHLNAALLEIFQNLEKENLQPVRYDNSNLEIIELEEFQTNNDMVIILRISLIEQQLYIILYLNPIPIYKNRTRLTQITF